MVPRSSVGGAGARIGRGRGEVMVREVGAAPQQHRGREVGIRVERRRRGLERARDVRCVGGDPYASEMNIVAIDVDGKHNAVSTTEGKTYIFQTDAMSSPEFGERTHVPLC